MSVWISGHRKSLFSTNELWRFATHPIILLVGVMLGVAAGAASVIMARAEFGSRELFALLYSVMPILINLTSAALATLLVMLKMRAAGWDRSAVVYVS